MVRTEYVPDVEAVLAARHDNGSDFWATPDNKIGVGDPFSTQTSLVILHELGLTRTHEAVCGALELLWSALREDGRFRIAPKGAIYPCYTVGCARILSLYDYAKDPRLQRTFDHLLEIQHDDGGWRCKKFSWGRGPETEFSNPGVTLWALDAFRFTEHLDRNPKLDHAVESLLDHWVVKRPTGPCHFGIGTLFMQVEYPFLRYNLFSYVYVLSFFKKARRDKRYLEALKALHAKLDDKGQLVVERPNRKLAKLAMCARGKPSKLATLRYQEILANLAR